MRDAFFQTDRFMDAVHVASHRVIRKMVDSALPQPAPKPEHAILRSTPSVHLTKITIAIEIHLNSTVPISHPRWRHACHDVVVVDPAVMRQIAIVDVSFVADARTSEREDAIGVRRDMRELASSGADRRHRSAK